MQYKPSYYNILVDHGPISLLYNGITSGLVKLPGQLRREILPFLGPQRPRQAGIGLAEWDPPTFGLDELPESVRNSFESFESGCVFLPSETNEQELLKNRYEHNRHNAPIFVTITTTLDCNLGCYYCYEDKTDQYLSKKGCDAIFEWMKERMDGMTHKKVYTDWYGGEPMLNQDAINYFSEKIIRYCDDHGLRYISSMISNGTRWPEDPAQFMIRNRIKDVQFTLDGPKDDHNKRRRYVDPAENPAGSFDTILETVDKLIGKINIYLRINVDPWVGRNALQLLDLFEAKGWFESETKFSPYLAFIGPMTERCGFLGKSTAVQDFQSVFDQMNHEFQERLGQYIPSKEMELLQYYPKSLNINCAAVQENSVVFGPDGRMYKCGLDVGDTKCAHDKLEFDPVEEQNPAVLPIIDIQKDQLDPDRWSNYDPFTHVKCSQCQYLPICLGGCPKAQMEDNEFYLKQQSEHWESNFDRIIRTYYDASAK